MIHLHTVRHILLLYLLGTILTGCTATALTPTLQVPILLYHYISVNPHAPGDALRTRLSVPPAQFAQQLAYLRRAGYTTITLDDLVAALHLHTVLPAKPVILTFDDGYADFFTNAYPLLQRYGDKATIYIITGRLDTPGYLSWSELRILAASPLITIGAHTRTHPELPALSAKQSWMELEGSKRDLETRLGIVVRHFAYPSGHYTATTLTQAAQIGFVTAVTTQEGSNERLDQLLTLPRIRVNGGAPLADLIAGLAGQREQRLRAGAAHHTSPPQRPPKALPK